MSNEWTEEKQREWIEREITDNMGTKDALILCSTQLGYGESIHKMVTNCSFEEIVNLGILDYEQIQVLDLIHSELN